MVSNELVRFLQISNVRILIVCLLCYRNPQRAHGRYSVLDGHTNDKQTVDLHSRRKYMHHGDIILICNASLNRMSHHNVLFLYATLVNKHFAFMVTRCCFTAFFFLLSPFITSIFSTRSPRTLNKTRRTCHH